MMNIRSKFLMLFLATAILPLTLLALFIYSSVRESITKDTESTIQNYALLREDRSGIIIDALSEKAQIVADNTDIKVSVDSYLKMRATEKQRGLNELLVNTSQNFKEVQSISIIDSQHRIIASSDSSLIGTNDQMPDKNAVFNVQNGNLPTISVKEPIVLNDTVIGSVRLVAQGEQIASLIQDYSGLGES